MGSGMEYDTGSGLIESFRLSSEEELLSSKEKLLSSEDELLSSEEEPSSSSSEELPSSEEELLSSEDELLSSEEGLLSSGEGLLSSEDELYLSIISAFSAISGSVCGTSMGSGNDNLVISALGSRVEALVLSDCGDSTAGNCNSTGFEQSTHLQLSSNCPLTANLWSVMDTPVLYVLCCNLLQSSQRSPCCLGLTGLPQLMQLLTSIL